MLNTSLSKGQELIPILSDNASQREGRGDSLVLLLLGCLIAFWNVFAYLFILLSKNLAKVQKDPMFPTGEGIYHVFVKPCRYVSFRLWCTDRINPSFVSQTKCFHFKDSSFFFAERGREAFVGARTLLLSLQKEK